MESDAEGRGLPEVGSEWEARDGRIMRIERWTRPLTYPDDDWWAELAVLNPGRGQRRSTSMSLGRFGEGGFLSPVTAQSRSVRTA